jgi:hypothetical protein
MLCFCVVFYGFYRIYVYQFFAILKQLKYIFVSEKKRFFQSNLLYLFIYSFKKSN